MSDRKCEMCGATDAEFWYDAPRDASGQIAPPWWQVMGFDAEPQDLAAVEARWRELAKERHPDKGGNDAEFALIVNAVREGREALK